MYEKIKHYYDTGLDIERVMWWKSNEEYQEITGFVYP